MRSDKPMARPFQRWVAHVIETIRETGRYELSRQLDDLKRQNDTEKADFLMKYNPNMRSRLMLSFSVVSKTKSLCISEKSQSSKTEKHSSKLDLRETSGKGLVAYARIMDPSPFSESSSVRSTTDSRDFCINILQIQESPHICCPVPYDAATRYVLDPHLLTKLN